MYRNVPGLYCFPDFFSSIECESIRNDALAIHGKLQNTIGSSQKSESTSVPQPDLVKSNQHNLASEQKFIRARLLDSDQRELKCEYFTEYGDQGHELAYFRGNGNLPQFALHMLPSIQQMIDSLENEIIVVKNQWRLTMNFYKQVEGAVSGFAFHVDIPANGVVTMILNIQRQANFQITDGNRVEDIVLPVGALLLLSGESRYQWKHRVLASHNPQSANGEIERISLVLGVQ